MEIECRYAGSLLGLACGDALGTTLEFASPGSYQPILDNQGDGPFQLPAGYWTDDTSMAMCLGESLLECGGFDAADQMNRYVRWWKEGYWSSAGRCFDIGNVTRAAIESYIRTGEPVSPLKDPRLAGNGSLMRLAPAVLYFRVDKAEAIRMAGESSRTTHAAQACVDSCRYLASLILGALEGVDKVELCEPMFSPAGHKWGRGPLHPEVEAVAQGSFRREQPPHIQASGYVVRSLEAALWAFFHGGDFEEGALKAVNLGGDADTIGAIYGQLAGAYYGEEAIPERWRRHLHRGGEIRAMGRRLLAASSGRPGGV
ncbi:MAG TPA: ADP-ribosylglycohydrolase family protein [Bryobacteraceae bacterium]|nr:ADP-ribosylglycohydrolase family protein [Bryobacteraceae bacterium]